ncbi:hypothetical protein HZS_3110 [Henneguya salminicola]|nr:hypothetical protein HZS_3110 [Henneguya salminicola]
MANISVMKLAIFIFLILKKTTQLKESVVVISEDDEELNTNLIENDKTINQEQFPPKIEVLSKHAGARTGYLPKVMIYLPLFIFIINLFWGNRTNDRILNEWMQNFKDKLYPYFCPESTQAQNLTYINDEGNKYSLFLTSIKPIHGYHVRMNKSICHDFSKKLSNIPPFIVAYADSYELIHSIITQELIDLFTARACVFNYISITDLFESKYLNDISPNLDTNANYMIVKASFSLTTSNWLSVILNELDDMILAYSRIVKTVSMFRLSKETKINVERNRLKLVEMNMKSEHLQRQEMAMKRKDEKIRALRQRIIAETDVEKQIKLQEKFDKYELKEKNKKLTKGKSMKVLS